MSAIVLNGSTSGQITISPPAVAGTNTLTLPAATGTVLTTAGGQTISGTTTVSTLNATTIQVGGNQAVNGPAFSAYNSLAQSLTNGANTKVQFPTKEFDTNSNYDNSTNYRFTPTVAGYYQITSFVATANANNSFQISIWKNGSGFKNGAQAGGGSYIFGSSVTALIYFNGSTDYVEIYAYQNSGSSQNTNASQSNVYFQGCLLRGA
jgi:hypothetical protein